jgi:serine/threonine-protein kinase
VYQVRRHTDGAILALKMILRGRGASFAELARFRIEAEALACLNHPNIVKIRDVGLHGGYPYIALEFAERGSLKQAIARGPQPPRQAAGLVRTLSSAMQHAHERGMLHRDLKPANVLLMGDGTPKVTDFGLVKFADPIRTVSEMHCTFSVSLLDQELSRFARELGAQYRSVTDAARASEDEITRTAWQQCAARTGVLGDEARFRTIEQFLSEVREQSQHPPPDLDGLTNAGAVMGSPNYMAPEQATGDLAAIGPRTDVYALGGILYELLTGRPLFRSESLSDLLSRVCSSPPVPPRQLAPEVSADIEAICLKCLEKSPGCRYQSAADLAEDLSHFLDDQKPQAARRKW